MVENIQAAETFKKIIGEHYTEYQRKMQQWAFINHLTYYEDVIPNTFLKCYETIIKKGLKDTSEQGCLNYFFKAIKLNTFLEHKRQSQRLNKSVDIKDINVEDTEPYDESIIRFSTFSRRFIDEQVKENFDIITYRVYRLRYLVRIDGKELNYKKIKQITKVKDTRKRIITVNKWLRENFDKDILKKEYDKFLKNLS